MPSSSHRSISPGLSYVLNPSRSLGTTDHVYERLLPPNAVHLGSAVRESIEVESELWYGDDTLLCELTPMLSREFCDDIVTASKRLHPDSMAAKYGDDSIGARAYKRLLVRDEQVRAVLWQALAPTLTTLLEGRSKRPLGFGTSEGEWKLAGLNPVLRINSCEDGDWIGLHLDAQY